MGSSRPTSTTGITAVAASLRELRGRDGRDARWLVEVGRLDPTREGEAGVRVGAADEAEVIALAQQVLHEDRPVGYPLQRRTVAAVLARAPLSMDLHDRHALGPGIDGLGYGPCLPVRDV